MDGSSVLRAARRRAGLSLRALADRAGTSHSTIAAYEAGRVNPSVATLDRLVRAAGLELEVVLSPRVGGGGADAAARGRELIEVLDLAEHFPARHERLLPYPRFGPR